MRRTLVAMASLVVVQRMSALQVRRRALVALRSASQGPGKAGGPPEERADASGRRLWAASDVLQFAKSPFGAWMERRYALAEREERATLSALRDPPDGFMRLLARKGDDWEREVLSVLGRDREVLDLSGASRAVRRDPRSATAATAAALRSGAELIYQPPLADALFVGVPDFLVLTQATGVLL